MEGPVHGQIPNPFALGCPYQPRTAIERKLSGFESLSTASANCGRTGHALACALQRDAAKKADAVQGEYRAGVPSFVRVDMAVDTKRDEELVAKYIELDARRSGRANARLKN